MFGQNDLILELLDLCRYVHACWVSGDVLQQVGCSLTDFVSSLHVPFHDRT